MVINKMNSEQIFKTLKLKENTLYKCKVMTSENNVEHTAFLFTGFKTGSYCEVYTNSYDHPININKIYSLKVVKKLSKIKTFK